MYYGDLRWGGCQNIPGLGWFDSNEFEMAPVVPVEKEVPGV